MEDARSIESAVSGGSGLNLPISPAHTGSIQLNAVAPIQQHFEIGVVLFPEVICILCVRADEQFHLIELS